MLALILVLDCSIEIPSGFEPILAACGSENFTDDSAMTTSKRGSIVTPIPETKPFKPHIKTFGNAARKMKKFLKKMN